MKFSVIIPTYNRRHQIGQAIESVFMQVGVELELIIVDDGSDDGTVEWLAQAYTDSRLTVLKNSRSKGPAGARNSGLLAATGDAVAFLDSDDCFLPGHLAACRDVFDEHPEVGLVFGPAIYEQNGQPVDYMGPNFERKLAQAEAASSDDYCIVFSGDYFAHLLKFGCYFNLSTVAIRTPKARVLMNETLRIAEDYEFWVRLSRSTRFASLRAPQIRYQLHDGNISFESASSAAENAPSQVSAYRIMLAYPDLTADHTAILNDHLAEVLFDWGYRCRLRGQMLAALNRHLQSMRYGRRLRNMQSLIKLLPLALVSLGRRWV